MARDSTRCWFASESGKSFLRLRQSTRTLHPRRSTEAFFVQSFPCTLADWYRGGLRVNIAQLWNMSKKTIMAVLDTPPKKDPFGSSER